MKSHPKLKKNITKAISLAVLAMFLFAALSGCSAGKAKTEDKGEIKIGVFNWAENVAACHMWEIILEEQGYEVDLIEGEKQPLFSAVASSDLDLALEVWLPHTDKPFWDEYKDDDWERMSSWYDGTKLGLAVPEYVDVNSITELNDNKDKFIREGEPTIVGIDGGASLMRMTEDAMEKYNLDYNLLESSGPAMTATLDSAINKKEPVVVTLWSPHWVFADYDLKYLEDPEGIYGEEEKIYPVSRVGFSEEFPEVARWIDNWKMDDQSLGSLMSEINDVEDPHQGAENWIEDNRELVDSWLD